MIEVFKTSIQNNKEANLVYKQIQTVFPDYIINFDLEDCDNILRIETREEAIDSKRIITILEIYGFETKLLPSEI